MTINVEFNLEKFCALGELHFSKSNWSKDEIYCKNHFKTNVIRDHEGRFIVALPFKENHQGLGESREAAVKRLLFFYKKRFNNNTKFEEQYTAVMSEYINLSHMSLIKNTSENGFYLPHRQRIVTAFH